MLSGGMSFGKALTEYLIFEVVMKRNNPWVKDSCVSIKL